MWYDIAVLAILLIAVIRGAMKGIVWQLAVIGAIVACFVFAEPLSLMVAPYIHVKAPLNRWLAMLILYLFFSFLSFLIARSLRKWIEKYKFVEFDRHIGAVFGLLKGIVLCLVITFFLVTLSETAQRYILNSASGHTAAVIMDRLHPVMPAELNDILKPYLDRFDSREDSLPQNSTPQDSLPQDSTSERKGGDNRSAAPGDSSLLADPGIEKIADEISENLDDQLRELVLLALKNTADENRPELIQKLRTSIPGFIRYFAEEWKNGKPAKPGFIPDDSPEKLSDAADRN